MMSHRHVTKVFVRILLRVLQLTKRTHVTLYPLDTSFASSRGVGQMPAKVAF